MNTEVKPILPSGFGGFVLLGWFFGVGFCGGLVGHLPGAFYLGCNAV